VPDTEVSLPEAGRIEQWLFTLDSATGEVCRIEKFDSASGSAQELSDSEYAALDSYLAAVAPGSSPEVSHDPAPTAGAAARAYWQGVADCAALNLKNASSGT
jgi:hypothetical protein